MARNFRFSKFKPTILIVGVLVIITSAYGIIDSLVTGAYAFGEYDYGLFIGVLLLIFYFKSGSKAVSNAQTDDKKSHSTAERDE